MLHLLIAYAPLAALVGITARLQLGHQYIRTVTLNHSGHVIILLIHRLMSANGLRAAPP